MKIMMLNDAMLRGGKERRLIELLKGLKKFPDIEVSLVLFSSQIGYPEVREHCANIHILERKPKKDPRVFFRLYRLVKKENPDILHSWGSMPSSLVLPSAILQNRKFLNAMVTNANPRTMRNKDHLRSVLTFPFSDAILGNSQAGLDAYKAPPQKSYCVHNGFDFKRLSGPVDPVAVRAQYQIQTPKVVGMVGAFEQRKDYPTYLKAAIRIAQQRSDVTFLSVGDGQYLDSCRALVPASLRSRILFPGMVRDVESLVKIFDVGVLASNSLVHGEGISNSILEYMALRKPVVATQGGGTPEIIREAETGFMVPPFEPELMTERINWLLSHPAEAQKMGGKGFARVRQHFNLKDMAQRYREIYDQLLVGQTIPAVKFKSS